MALITYSALITNINGKMGGTVFKGVHGQMQVIQNKTARNPKKNQTLNAPGVNYSSKTSVAIAAQAWRNLTDGKRTQWKAAAASYTFKNRAGTAFVPSGYAYFVSVMANAANASRAVPAVPSTPAVLTNLGAITVNAVITGNVFTISTENEPSANETVLVRCSPPLSKGKSFQAGFMRVIDAKTSADTQPWDEIDAYNEVFGAMQANQRFWLSLQVINTVTGQSLPPLVTFVDVTA